MVDAKGSKNLQLTFSLLTYSPTLSSPSLNAEKSRLKSRNTLCYRTIAPLRLTALTNPIGIYPQFFWQI